MPDAQEIFWKWYKFVFFALYIHITWMVNFSERFSNGTRFYVYINVIYFSKSSNVSYVSEYICIYCELVLVIWDSPVFFCAWKPFPVEYLVPLGNRFCWTTYFYLFSLSKGISIMLEENLIHFASRSIILKCIIWQELGAILLAVGHFTSLSHQQYILIH